MVNLNKTYILERLKRILSDDGRKTNIDDLKELKIEDIINIIEICLEDYKGDKNEN